MDGYGAISQTVIISIHMTGGICIQLIGQKMTEQECFIRGIYIGFLVRGWRVILDNNTVYFWVNGRYLSHLGPEHSLYTKWASLVVNKS